jgi:hypothetical protein
MQLNKSIIAAALLALIAQTTSTLAQAVHQGGEGEMSTFSDKYNNFLAMTQDTTDQGNKLAMIGMEKGTDDKTLLIAHFWDAATWEQFVAIWSKAQATATPNAATPNGYIPIDQFILSGDDGLLIVNKGIDGSVEFTIIRGDLVKRTFTLAPSLFAAFNTKIAEMNKIFPTTP